MTADDSALAGRYAFIDAVPDALLDAVVANAHGKLRPRAEAIVVLRDALLAGRIPLAGELAWPDAALRQPLLDALARSGVAAHCAANAGITDQVLAGLLGATDQAQRHYDELLAEWTLAARERDRRTRTVGLFPGDGPPGDAVFDEAAWQRLVRLRACHRRAHDELATRDRSHRSPTGLPAHRSALARHRRRSAERDSHRASCRPSARMECRGPHDGTALQPFDLAGHGARVRRPGRA